MLLIQLQLKVLKFDEFSQDMMYIAWLEYKNT